MANPPNRFCVRLRTPREVNLVRLAAEGRHMSIEDFLRIAVLQAACQTQGVFGLPADSTIDASHARLASAAERLHAEAQGPQGPGEAVQIVAEEFLKVEEIFKKKPKRTHALWFKPSDDEQAELQRLKVALGDIVHGREGAQSVEPKLVDGLRELAWQFESNRARRKTGLPVMTLPDGAARVEDGVLSIKVGLCSVRVTLGRKNRKTCPGPSVFMDAALQQVAGGRWKLLHSAVLSQTSQTCEAASPRATRRRRTAQRSA